jgi:ankyrin repeat protein
MLILDNVFPSASTNISFLTLHASKSALGMRLLSTNTDGGFNLTSFTGNIPSYAILSHTWGADDQEVTFQDMISGSGTDKAGYRKIQFCGNQAKRDGLQYFWVDSCCIDKSDVVELQSSINSMFRWYQNAAKCYVYLSDISTGEHPQSSVWEPAFKQSRWFTRGWTLQELLAPRLVEFFSRDGQRLGSKHSLQPQIFEISRIPIEALKGNLSGFSEQERKSWALRRETTIEEDQVYCLLGIFGVFLPLIYGEGQDHAFRRLQDEIDKHSGIRRSTIAISRWLTCTANWTKDELECLQALRTSDYERFKNRNPNRFGGTCQWVFQHERFQNWQQSGSSSLLWISADPGCGKSVLSKSLIDKDLKPTPATICYFFFKDDSEQQRSISNALCALLHQFFDRKRRLIHYALEDYAAEGSYLSKSFHKLWNILTKAMTDPGAGEVVCVLDALDECEESGRYEIIGALNAFYGSSGGASNLKFFLTSRPYFDIESRFRKLTHDMPTIRLRGEMESAAISNEIEIVIRESVKTLGVQLELTRQEKANLQRELLGMKHRTYLWLKLILDVILDEVSPTAKRLKRITGTLPSTVHEAYEAILSKSKDPVRARKLLHIVVAATNPLTLTEMNIALAIEDHHRSYEDLDLESDSRFEHTLRNICGLFVSVVDRKVYLFHQTAKEFLMAKSQETSSGWKYSLDPVDSHLVIARTCIAYLMFDIFDDSIAHTAEHGYLDYASKFWALHYQAGQVGESMETLPRYLKLCDIPSKRFQTWFNIYWKSTHRSWESNPGFTSTLLLASYFGHEAVVKLLLSTGKVDVDSKYVYFGRKPLSWAAERGQKAVVKLLLATGKVDVKAKDKYGRTPLLCAAGRGHEAVVKLLLATGNINVDSKDSYFGQRTLLSRAAGRGQEAVVKLLLATGKVDVNYKDNHGRTPLSWAAEKGHEAVVELLLATDNVDVDSEDTEYGRTPLLLATGRGREAVVKLLLATGKADLDATDNCGQTPLLWAAGLGHEVVVKLLLATRKADVDFKDIEYGRTLLSWAAGGGHEAVVKLLLATGNVDVDSKDNRNGRTPLSFAAEGGHGTVVKLLLATGKIDVDLEDKHCRTPLSFAAERGLEAVVKLLVMSKVNLDSMDSSGQTPLLWAAGGGHEAVVNLLLATGKVDVDLEDKHGRTPLSFAAGRGYGGVVKLLLATGVNIDYADHADRTPLSFAAGRGHEAVVKLLLATSKADVDLKDKWGRTLLSRAARGGHEAVVKLLLATGKVDVDSTDYSDRTPLSFAAGRGYGGVVKLLLATGRVNVNSADRSSRTPLSYAAGRGYGGVVKLLLATGKVTSLG